MRPRVLAAGREAPATSKGRSRYGRRGGSEDSQWTTVEAQPQGLRRDQSPCVRRKALELLWLNDFTSDLWERNRCINCP